MDGVNFGLIHSFIDLNLILAPFTPPPAEPVTNFLSVPGRDGYLDLTEANGEVKFKSRELQFTFTAAADDDLSFDERLSAVSNALNGQQFRITLDRDPNYYWFGRCVVKKNRRTMNIPEIVVKATVDPYKLKQSETILTVELSETVQILSFVNDRMAAVPVIECTEDGAVVVFNGETFTLTAGTQKILDIRFVEGNNTVDVSGSGTITFTWQEGAL